MNVIELLKLDHRVVDALFQKAMSMQPSKRGPVYKKISNELAAHAHIEEVILYPRLIKDGDKELKKIVLEGIEEHAQIHMFHDQLDKMQPAEERFEPKLTVLQEDIRHHVKEEENEMFQMVEDQFSAESLERLGEELETERKRFQKQKGIPARTTADKALGQGTLSRFVDAVTGMFTSESQNPPKSGKKSSSSSKKPESGTKAGNPNKSTSGRSSAKGNGTSRSTASSTLSKSTSGKSNTPARSASASGAKRTLSGKTSNGKSAGRSTNAVKSASGKTKSAASRSASRSGAR